MTGRARRVVTDAVARRLPDLEGYDAYLCGPPPMMTPPPPCSSSAVSAPEHYFDAFAPSGSGCVIRGRTVASGRSGPPGGRVSHPRT